MMMANGQAERGGILETSLKKSVLDGDLFDG